MRGRRVRIGVAVAVLVAATATGGCAGDDGLSRAPEPTPESPPVPESSPPPSDRLTGQLRQSSHDRARDQMEVWIANDTGDDVTPTRIVYRDPRLAAPVLGERLRTIPASSERGFTLAFPDAICPSRGQAAPLELTYGGRTRRLPVDDSVDVVGRHVDRECVLRRVGRIADVRFADRVEIVDGTGHLVLLVTPTGRTDDELVLETVNGSHLLGHPHEPFWSPGVRVHGRGEPVRIRLPVEPTRCDPHAFQEGGGATTFLVRLRVDGKDGQVALRTSPKGTAAALDWAADVCHLGERGVGQD